MKTIQKLGAGIIVIAAISAGWYYSNNQQHKTELSSLLSTIKVLELKSSADESFIMGEHEDAFYLYRQLDSLTGDSLAFRRSTFAINTSSDSNKILTLSRKLEQTIALLTEYQEREKFMKEETVDKEIDTEEEYKNEILSLNQKLAATQKEIEGLKTNHGVIRFTSTKNGSVTYIGDLRDGKADGAGFGLWNTGSSYQGSWRNNLRHGKGVFQWADGEKYEGDYANDQRHGFGVYTAKAGKYEGEWLNDMRHGEGRLFEANGKLKVHGVWEKDKLIKTIK
jgi:hypothetical protein